MQCKLLCVCDRWLLSSPYTFMLAEPANHLMCMEPPNLLARCILRCLPAAYSLFFYEEHIHAWPSHMYRVRGEREWSATPAFGWPAI